MYMGDKREERVEVVQERTASSNPIMVAVGQNPNPGGRSLPQGPLSREGAPSAVCWGLPASPAAGLQAYGQSTDVTTLSTYLTLNTLSGAKNDQKVCGPGTCPRSSLWDRQGVEYREGRTR